jgi:hypothetical protein
MKSMHAIHASLILLLFSLAPARRGYDPEEPIRGKGLTFVGLSYVNNVRFENDPGIGLIYSLGYLPDINTGAFLSMQYGGYKDDGKDGYFNTTWGFDYAVSPKIVALMGVSVGVFRECSEGFETPNGDPYCATPTGASRDLNYHMGAGIMLGTKVSITEKIGVLGTFDFFPGKLWSAGLTYDL